MTKKQSILAIIASILLTFSFNAFCEDKEDDMKKDHHKHHHKNSKEADKDHKMNEEAPKQ